MENIGGQTKSLEYTCTFCRKSFPTAQALGGHQNAHRRERREEKKLFIKDPAEYRKRAFLQTVRPPVTTDEAPSHPHVYVDFLPIQSQPQVNRTLGRHDWTPMSNPSLDLNLIPPMEVNGNAFDAGMDGNGINYEAMDLNLKL